MTDSKPKDVCDTLDYGHAQVGMSVCVRLQRCRKVLGVCRFSCDSMTREPSHAFSAESLDLILGSRIGGVRCGRSGCAVPAADQGVPCLPRIGCAVPAVPFTTGPDSQPVVKNRIDPSTILHTFLPFFKSERSIRKKGKLITNLFI